MRTRGSFRILDFKRGSKLVSRAMDGQSHLGNRVLVDCMYPQKISAKIKIGKSIKYQKNISDEKVVLFKIPRIF